jgi:hypothetical protein
MENTNVILTDLAEAREIVEHNLVKNLTDRANIRFEELDWEEDSSELLQGRGTPIDLVIAADCTYNPDSRWVRLVGICPLLTLLHSPALVKTMHEIAKIWPHITVAIAMKIRHSSEEVFFGLMSNAGFCSTKTFRYPLPGDEDVGEETVHLYIYQYEEKRDGVLHPFECYEPSR